MLDRAALRALVERATNPRSDALIRIQLIDSDAQVRGTSILTLSMRRLADLVGYSSLYEFEDVLQAVTGAERVDATGRQALEFSRRSYKYTRLLTGSRSVAARLAPRPTVVSLQRKYDLFFACFNHPHELYTLAVLPQWRRHCRFGACYIVELWPHLLPRYLLEMLADFDHIFLGCSNSVAEVARISGRPCTYLPLGADVLALAPYPNSPQRLIDVCNLGRRSPVTHAALLELASAQGIFYYFDTVAASGEDLKQRTFHVENPHEHRLLLASILQRSRYFIANRARANQPEFMARGDEISARFYEGAATGTVMLGEPPRSAQFQRQFDWPDALLSIPFDAPQIADFIAQLEREPQRLARIRQDNIHQAARRHDWTYRVRTVFEQLGLPATEAMVAREAQLQALAVSVDPAATTLDLARVERCAPPSLGPQSALG
jgi:hypothetical protein